MCLWDVNDGRCIEFTKLACAHTGIQVGHTRTVDPRTAASHTHTNRNTAPPERGMSYSLLCCSHFLFLTQIVFLFPSFFFQSLVRPCVLIVDQFIWLPFNYSLSVIVLLYTFEQLGLQTHLNV